MNQTIAIRLIRKFGFSVNAVWNGKEALDYLLQPPTPDHPKPDIILMDVQMPVLDGYRATHLIRHHSPYSTVTHIRTLPVVAMTASAIQGDEEKCVRAGMDDYLAKPVQGKVLEEMLVKWALEGKRKCRVLNFPTTRQSDHDSNCDHPPSISASEASDSTNSRESRRCTILLPEPGNGPSGVKADGRGLQRDNSAEQARSSRDDKLLALSSATPRQFRIFLPSPRPEWRPDGPRTPLTLENIARLNREVDPFESAFIQATETGEGDGEGTWAQSLENSPQTVNASGIGSPISPINIDPGSPDSLRMALTNLMNNESNSSQVTITQSDNRD